MVYESEIRQSDWLLTRRRQLMFVAESADIPKQQQDLKKFKKKRKNQRKSIRKKEKGNKNGQNSKYLYKI